MAYTLEDLPHLQQEYDDRYHTAVEQLETSLEAMDTLLQISQYRMYLDLKSNISMEDVNHLTTMLQIGLGLESDDFSRVFPALEDATAPEESMEYMDTTIGEKLGYVGRVGLNAIKGLGEFLRYSVNIIHVLSKEYNTSVDLVQNFDKGTITLRNNEYFCYGDNKKQVKDIQSYTDELDKSISLLITVADSMGQYTRDSFLDNLKVFAAYATFTKGKVFNGMFDDLYKMTNKITDHPNMKKTSDEYNTGFAQYESDVMLGMFNVTVTQMPKSKDPDYLSIDAKRKYAKVMKLNVSHYVTKKPVKIDQEIDFTVDKKDFDKINDSIRPLLSSYDKFNSNMLRLTLAEKIFNVVEPVVTHMWASKRLINWLFGPDSDEDDVLDLTGKENPYIDDNYSFWTKENTNKFNGTAFESLIGDLSRKFGNLRLPPEYIKAGKTGINLDLIGTRLIMLRVFLNYNILIKTSLMIIQTNHTIFSLLRGHIKNAIEINKKLAAQQS